MPNTSEVVAKRLLDHCLSDWKRHALRFQRENPNLATEQIRSRLKWYMPLVHFSAQAYFNYWDSMDLAQLWDSMAACDRGEWIITQLRGCIDCPDCVQDATTYFEVAHGATYGEVAAELAKDLGQSDPNEDVFLAKPA